MKTSALPALAAALVVALPAYADTTNPTLPAMSVTAKGYAADDLETPLSTVTLSRDELLQRGARNVGEALRGEPGLAVASDGAQGQNPVIRGLKKESVVLLVDGMRLNSAQPQGAIASFMSLGLADRLEVVKGATSVLYGTGALGGVINVLLPQAKFDADNRIAATASYDSASNGFRSTGVGHISQGDHALMLGASLARNGDYRGPEGNVARTGYDSDSVIGQYRFRIDSAQQLRVSLQQSTDTDVWYPGSSKPFTTPAASVAAVQRTVIHSPKQERVLAEVGYSKKDTGATPLNLDVRVYQQQVARQILAWTDAMGRDISRTQVYFKTNGLDAKADWLLHPQHLVSFGSNVWRMTASPERWMFNPPHTNTYLRLDPFTDGQIDAIGFYLQDDIRLDKLNLLAALRHDTVKGSASSVANSSNPTLARITDNLGRTDNALSGSLGANYELLPMLRPYANLSRGFRAGEMRERYESSPRGDGYYYVGNPQIRPEISTQLELGIKGEAADTNYQVAVWRNRISDFMSGQDISGTARATTLCGAANSGACKETINITQVVLTGLEGRAKWRAWAQHWFSAGFSAVRGVNKELNEPLFQMPADEVSFGWEGSVASILGAGWTADTTLRLVREQTRVATTFARSSENTTPGFGTMDIGATWRYQKNQSLRVAMKNLADKAYHEHLAEGVSGQEIRAPGRSLLLTWQGQF